jgi:hypothetical protein
MENQGLNGELEDFDLTHYCEANPNYCFFFRFLHKREQTAEQLEDESTKPIVSMSAIVLNETPQVEEPSSEKTDKLFKLKRFLNYFI